MNLEGSLDAFSLPEILQLLAFSKKTGALHVDADPRRALLFVRDGLLTGATSDPDRALLVRRLLGTGRVDEGVVAAALPHVQPGSSLVNALRANVATADLEQATADQLVDVMFDLLRWTEGNFSFVVDEVNPDDVGIAVALGDVLAQVEARTEAWRELTSVLPSPNVVLSIASSVPADVAVSRTEWALLALVDGQRTVADVLSRFGIGEFSGLEQLAGLVRRGLLSVDALQTDRFAVLATVETGAPAPTPVKPVVEPAPVAAEVPQIPVQPVAPEVPAAAASVDVAATDADSPVDRALVQRLISGVRSL